MSKNKANEIAEAFGKIIGPKDNTSSEAKVNEDHNSISVNTKTVDKEPTHNIKQNLDDESLETLNSSSPEANSSNKKTSNNKDQQSKGIYKYSLPLDDEKKEFLDVMTWRNGSTYSSYLNEIISEYIKRNTEEFLKFRELYRQVRGIN